MPATTVPAASLHLHGLLNDLAMQLLLGPPGPAGTPWSTLLDEIVTTARDAGMASISTEALRLKQRLASLDCEGAEFSGAAQSGVQHLQEALESAANARAATSKAASDSIGQDAELIADFALESREHLQGIEQCVLALEHDSSSLDPIHEMFRAFHTIKGIAGFLELHDIRNVAHETETLLDLARNGNLTLASDVTDVILESADYLSREISRIEQGGTEEAAPTENLVFKLRGVIDAAGNSDPLRADSAEPDLSADDTAGNYCGEVLPDSGLSALSRAVETGSTSASPEPSAVLSSTKGIPGSGVKTRKGSVSSSIKVDTAKLDFLVDTVGEMVIAQSLVRHNPDLVKTQSAALMRNVAQLSRITSEVQKTAMSMRMVPIGVLFQKMTRLVRDLSRKSGKQAEMITVGEETELDRNIVEELADPLMHMVRNAIDHGIETPAERLAAGKPTSARIELRASHQGGHIMIEISDDGRGMNRDAILNKAREKRIVAADAVLSDSEIYNLIFEPGFSTAAKVTDLSGRGVGMDVVRKQIQKLRGRTEIKTVLGKGTTFELKLPLTLAIIDGLVVGVGSERYIVPIFAVREMLRPAEGMVSTIENKREIALIRDRVLPVVRLHRRVNVTPRTENPLESLLILTESQGTEYCLMVDTLIGKQEVVIKSLGESLRNVQGIAGGAILGDGRVALILDMNALFHTPRIG
jgi:two-component system chemotaxis sensor kinase CheA